MCGVINFARTDTDKEHGCEAQIRQLDPRQCRTAQVVKFDTGIKSGTRDGRNKASTGVSEHTWKAWRKKTCKGDPNGRKTRYRKYARRAQVKISRTNFKTRSGLSGISTKNWYRECSERSEQHSCCSKKMQQAAACCGTICQSFGHEQ